MPVEQIRSSISKSTEAETVESPRDDKYQSQRFKDLVEDDGIEVEHLEKVLKLRNITTRSIFYDYGHTLIQNGSATDHEFPPRQLIHNLRETIKDLEEIKDLNLEQQEKKDYCYTMLSLAEKYGWHICSRVNLIFKNRNEEIAEIVIPKLDNQLSEYYKDGGHHEMDFLALMKIARKNPETVDVCLPLLKDIKDYDKIFEIIRDNQQLAGVLAELSSSQTSPLNNDVLRKLIEYYHAYRRINFNDSSFHLPDSNNYCPDPRTKMQYRIPWQLSTHALVWEMQETRDLAANLESALGAGTADDIWETQILDGEGRIYIDKTADYILIRVQGTDAFQFEPYYLKINKSGLIESRPGLGEGEFFDRGIMLRENSTWTKKEVRDEDSDKLIDYKYTITATFDELKFIDAITRKINGDQSVDIGKESGLEDYILSKPL